MAPPFTLRFGSLDLAPYIRVGNDEGFDPYDSGGFEEPAFIDNPFGEGQGLANVDSRNREMSWPLYLSSTGGPVTNLVTNPSFEVDTAGWELVASAGLASGPTMTVSTAWASAGSRSCRVQFTNANDTVSRRVDLQTPRTASNIPVTAGVSYSARAAVNVLDAASLGTGLALFWIDSASAVISGSYGAVSTATGVQGVTVTGVAPAGATGVAVLFITETNAANDVVDFYADAVMIAEGTTIPDYDDGDTPGWDWSGTPHASTSSRPGGKDGLHAIVRDINQEIRYAARPLRVEWRDQDATASTFFDVEYARFDPNFKMRPSAQKWLAGKLTVWCKPYGHTATERIAATGVATLAPHVTLSVPSIAGDVSPLTDARVKFTYRGSASPVGDMSGRVYTVLSSIPSGWTTFLPATSLRATYALNGASGAAGSQVLIASVTQQNQAVLLGQIYPNASAALRERMRIVALAKTSQGTGCLRLVNSDMSSNESSPGGATVIVGLLSQGYTLFDLGVGYFDERIATSGYLVYADSVTATRANIHLNGIYLLPDETTRLGVPTTPMYTGTWFGGSAIASFAILETDPENSKEGNSTALDAFMTGPPALALDSTRQVFSMVHRSNSAAQNELSVEVRVRDRFTFAR